MYSVKDKFVLVTGASSGIGREMARCLAEQGAHCVLGALPHEEQVLRGWCSEIQNRFRVHAWPVPIDLGQDGGPVRLHARVTELVPHLDVLVNNAGIMAYGNFHETPLEKHLDLVNVNARAYMSLMRLFLPQMIERGQGRILNVSSAGAFQPTPHHSVYGATKVFVQNLSEAVSQEVKGTGVKICTFNPSYTDTPLLKGDDFPRKLWWYQVSGMSDPATIAEQAVEAIKRGQPVYIPGWRNRVIHGLLPRFLPRKALNFVSYHVLKQRKISNP